MLDGIELRLILPAVRTKLDMHGHSAIKERVICAQDIYLSQPYFVGQKFT